MFPVEKNVRQRGPVVHAKYCMYCCISCNVRELPPSHMLLVLLVNYTCVARGRCLAKIRTEKRRNRAHTPVCEQIEVTIGSPTSHNSGRKQRSRAPPFIMCTYCCSGWGLWLAVLSKRTKIIEVCPVDAKLQPVYVVATSRARVIREG